MRVQLYPDPVPEVLCVYELPERIRAMILHLLAHQDVICRYDILSVELHCHRDKQRDRVKPKLCLLP